MIYQMYYRIWKKVANSGWIHLFGTMNLRYIAHNIKAPAAVLSMFSAGSLPDGWLFELSADDVVPPLPSTASSSAAVITFSSRRADTNLCVRGPNGDSSPPKSLQNKNIIHCTLCDVNTYYYCMKIQLAFCLFKKRLELCTNVQRWDKPF